VQYLFSIELSFYASEIRRDSDINNAAGEYNSSNSPCDEKADRENDQDLCIFLIEIGIVVEKWPKNN